ncbi:MAG: N-acetylmuramoyl-L-alanine amidase [Elusimicrobia bacterium]|jgi:N-acetylmuramoyl-L-alanine amidase|nr:N-acetylmuramoyl-L-alanine amidase [Elusimicrobiota bacterium]
MRFSFKTIPLLFTVIFISVASSFGTTSIDIDIVKDGTSLKTIELALIKKMGYLKGRDVADIFNADIEYRKFTKEVFLKWPVKEGSEQFETPGVKLKIGSDIVAMEGIDRKMMKTPKILNGKVYLPLEAVITRAFESVTGAQIQWSFKERKLWISYEGNIADSRYYTYNDYTRFVIEMTQKLEYIPKASAGGIFIKIDGAKLSVPIKEMIVEDGVINKVIINENEEFAEFIIKLAENAGEYDIKKFPSPSRIVVDIKNKDAEKKKREVTRKMDKLPPHPAGPAKRDKVDIDDIKLVVIDPGHGGKDPGAIGPRGTKEKDVVLAIAKKTAAYIKKDLKVRVLLTRTDDYFVPLAGRIKMANDKEADIFISIHANASFNPESEGFEIYFLSDSASDQEAQAVANMENSVVAMEQGTKDLSKVNSILWSLTMNQFLNESSELCSFINDEAVASTGLVKRGVKQAGFYVMKGARMPAVLVETAFISNKREEKLLNDKNFQDKMARSISTALKSYRRWIKRR